MFRPSISLRARGACALPAIVFVSLLVGCGGGAQTQPASSTQLTSATVAPENQNELTSARIAELEAARDRAIRRADDAQAVAAAQRERNDKALRAIVARDDFEDSMWSKVERIDARMKALRLDAARLAPDQRFKVLHDLQPIAEHRNAVEKQIHRIHSVPEVAWDSYKRDVERDLNAVLRELDEIQPKP